VFFISTIDILNPHTPRFKRDFEEYNKKVAKDIYKQAFDKYGESPKSLHWVNYASQAIRFKNLVADLELEDKSILDAGCGMGDILPFIYTRASRFDYLGVDINKDFIKVARKRYDGHKFKVGDPFFGRIRHRFDVVLSCGVMNENIPDWLEVRKQMIANLFENTRETLAFNMAGSLSYIPPDSKIAYADAQQIYDYCKSLTSQVSLKTGYSNYDFTIIMRR
jgi:SAM-dependent methyltransferase